MEPATQRGPTGVAGHWEASVQGVSVFRRFSKGSRCRSVLVRSFLRPRQQTLTSENSTAKPTSETPLSIGIGGRWDRPRDPLEAEARRYGCSAAQR